MRVFSQDIPAEMSSRRAKEDAKCKDGRFQLSSAHHGNQFVVAEVIVVVLIFVVLHNVIWRAALTEAVARAEAQAARKAEVEAQARARVEAQARVRVEAQARARVEAQARARVEAQARARVEAQARARVEAQARARVEAQARARVEAQARARVEAQARARVEAQARARVEAQARARVPHPPIVDVEGSPARAEAEAAEQVPHPPIVDAEGSPAQALVSRPSRRGPRHERKAARSAARKAEAEAQARARVEAQAAEAAEQVPLPPIVDAEGSPAQALVSRPSRRGPRHERKAARSAARKVRKAEAEAQAAEVAEQVKPATVSSVPTPLPVVSAPARQMTRAGSAASGCSEKNALGSHARTSSLEGTGIMNKGNQCSLNSVVQLLRGFPAFRQGLLAVKAASQSTPAGRRSSTVVSGEMAASTTSRREARRQLRAGEEPKSLLEALGTLFSAIEQHRPGDRPIFIQRSTLKRFLAIPIGGDDFIQADAPEILGKLLDVVEEEVKGMEGKAKTMEASVGALRGEVHVVQQCSCGTMATKHQSLKVLSLPMIVKENHAEVTLTQLLHERFSKEDLETACSSCKGAHGESWSFDSKLSRAPEKLFIQLQRMEWRSLGYGEKLSYPVEFGLELDTAPFSIAGGNSMYDLDGVIHHLELGACSNIASSRYRGHYVTFRRTGQDSWVKFDDLEVAPTTTAEALGAGAYVLSYTLRS